MFARHIVVLRNCALSLLAGLLFTCPVQADHFSGASISYVCLGGGLYTVTLDMYMDCSGVPLTTQSMRFENDCGTVFTLNNLLPTITEEVSQICPALGANTSCNGGSLPGFHRHRFERTLFLSPCDSWRISWWVCCRNVMVNVVNEPGIYVATTMNNSSGDCDDSPVFVDDGIPFVCVNEPVLYNPGVTDPNGNTLSFQLINAQFGAPNPFPVTYEPGFSGIAPVPGIIMDPQTGQITFTPTVTGNYTVAYRVSSFDAFGNLLGTVIRDLMFVVTTCDGSPPTTEGLVNPSGGAVILAPFILEVCDGLPFCADLVFTDPDPGQVVSMISNALALLPGATFSVAGTSPAVVTICWTANAAQLPINVYLQASDGTCPVENTASVSVLIQTAVPLPVVSDPGGPGNLAVCGTEPAVDLFTLLTGSPDAGGTWTGPSGASHPGLFVPGSDVLGVYTYLVGNACTNASSTVTVSSLSPDPGTAGSLSLCSNSAAQNLLLALGGSPDPGGAWIGPGGASSGTFTPGVDAPGAYIYSVGGGVCPVLSATVTVAISNAPNAGSNGSLTLCTSASPVALFASLNGVPQSGGSWTGPGGASFGGTFDPAVHAAGNYVYTVAGVAPCTNASATVSVSMVGAANAGSDGSLTVCSTSAAIDLFAQLGSSPDVGGSWSGPAGSMNGSFTPGVDVPGVYTYSVSGVAPCPGDQSTVTVTVTNAPNAGSNGSLTVCTSGSPVTLFPALNGSAQVGGSWTGPSGGSFNGTFDPAINAAGNYVYTVSGVAPCTNASATVSVSIVGAANAGSDGALSVCSTSATIDLFAQLGGSPDAGGSWSGPAGSMNGSFTPGVDVPGVYTYSVSGVAPCPGDQSTVTIAVTNAPNAGSNGSLSVCTSGSPVALFPSLNGVPQSGGVWTGPGGVPFGGTFDPSVHTAGNYVYTVAGVAPCANASAIVAVSTVGAANAGSDGSLTVCSTSAAIDLFAQLGGSPDAGGSWSGPSGSMNGSFTPGVDAPGVYTYSVSGVAPCPGDQSTVTVAVTNAPNAGSDGSLTVCTSGPPVTLFPALNGSAQVGGVWTGPGGASFGGTFDPAVHAAGNYVYTVAGVAPCANASATVSVSTVGAANAGSDGSLTVCSTSAAIDLFSQLGGSPDAGGSWSGPSGSMNGSFTPGLDAPGVYTYTLSGVAPCAGDQSAVTIAVEQASNAGSPASVQLCNESPVQDLFVLLGSDAQTGGTWTGPSGAAATALFNPAIDVPGAYTYLVQGTVCSSSSAVLQVAVLPAPQAGTNNSVLFCSSDAPIALISLLGGTPDAGGTWTNASGATVAPLFDPGTDAAGLYTYSVQVAPQCAIAQATLTITLFVQPQAGNNGALSLCSNAATALLTEGLGGNFDANGSWTDPSGVAHGAFIDPLVDVSGTYTYTVLASSPCVNAVAEVVVLVVPAPNAGSSAEVLLCSSQDAVQLLSLLGGIPDAGGQWNGPDGSAVGPLFQAASQPAGVYTYVVTGAPPCAAAQAQLTIGIGQAVNAGTNASLTLCHSDAAVDLFLLLGAAADPGGQWTGPDGAPTNSLVDPATAASGNYSYTLVAQEPCPLSVAVVAVSVIAQPVAEITALGNGACAPAEIVLQSGYNGPGTCTWLLGDGQVFTDCGPISILFTSSGNISVVLLIDPGNACPSAAFSLADGITVQEPPVADFSTSPEHLTVQQPLLFATNTSTGASSYSWSVDGVPVSTVTDLQYSFPDVLGDTYTLCLVALVSTECSDTLCLPITVEDGPLVFVPNAFSPDGDGINDYFLPTANGLAPGSYLLEVYDRWGRVLFRTTDPAEGWDGSTGGEVVPQGVYVWQLAGKDLRSTERIQRSGHVTLVR